MSGTAPPELALEPGALNDLADAVGAENVTCVMSMMLGTVPATREDLRAASCVGDFARLGRAAHQLKGDCAYLGAPALAARLQGIETRALAELQPPTGPEVDSVLAQVDRFIEALRRELAVRAAAG